MHYRIGSRGSKLALIQTEYVCEKLKKAYPEHTFEIVIVKTKGDKIQNRPLDQIGGKGLFVKEIEEKILKDELHMGVHSMKDMPAQPAEGLMFTKAWGREDPRDVLILRKKNSFEELPLGAVIGTGSKRRAYQLQKLRPDLKIVDIRGNVDTRLRKMEEQQMDGIVLAAAGLKRLRMEDKITQYLTSSQMISAPAQGVLALEVRKNNYELIAMLDAFCDEEINLAVKAERAFLERMGGGCYMPVGAVCQKIDHGNFQMEVMFGDEQGKQLSFASVEGSDPEEMAKNAEREIRRQMAGVVTLVGAGPGDPGLLTLKGKEAIAKADCMIYDRLAAPELLEYAKADCEMIYAGKENHHHTLKQDEINQLLVEKAMEYENVVRLKGGDVYVFGRGGEEGLYLKEHGVAFQIIPGISSAIAGPAYAGIPVTHRGLASGFHVVTAHNRRDELAEIDFEAMARSKDTCIFLMGLSKVREIAEHLMEAGMAANTKAAVISKATMPEQKACVSDLTHIADEVEKVHLLSPAIIIVGDVVGLKDSLDVITEEIESKKSCIVPKIGKETSRLTKLLRKQNVFVEEIQVGEICKKDCVIEKRVLEQIQWLIFTSRNGIRGFFENLYALNLDARDLSGVKIAVIGEKTGDYLKTYGVRADFIPKEFHEAGFIKEFSSVVRPTDTVWYAGGVIGGEMLCRKLADVCKIQKLCVYENRAVEVNEGKVQENVLFTCASSAERWINSLDLEDANQWKQEGKAYSIGPKTSEKLRKMGVKHIIEAPKSGYQELAKIFIEK